MTTNEQVTKYARVATGLVRLARNSREPGKLVESAARMAERLIDVSRTLTDDKESLRCWKAGAQVQAMLTKSFGPFFRWN